MHGRVESVFLSIGTVAKSMRKLLGTLATVCVVAVRRHLMQVKPAARQQRANRIVGFSANDIVTYSGVRASEVEPFLALKL